jgi:hypothetical protein
MSRLLGGDLSSVTVSEYRDDSKLNRSSELAIIIYTKMKAKNRRKLPKIHDLAPWISLVSTYSNDLDFLLIQGGNLPSEFPMPETDRF